MPNSRRATAYDITWLVRRLFRALPNKADAYLREAGLSAAERAVMEFLYPDEELSVPAIAARYDVSRQHVQVTVNALLKKELLRAEDNPQHRRSPLLRLSSAGRERFAEIRRLEAAIVDQIVVGISDAALATTAATLQSLYQNVKGKE